MKLHINDQDRKFLQDALKAVLVALLQHVMFRLAASPDEARAAK